MQVSTMNSQAAQMQATHVVAPKDREQDLLNKKLTPEEEKEVRELKKRDQEVRQHEQAHKAAAGQFATSGPKYELQTGPDGKQYAVGGEVEIDISEVPDDPEATIKKAQTIKRAALAPKDPSPQDRQVAAEAGQLETKARKEIAEEKQKEVGLYDRNGQRSASTQSQSVFLNIFV